MPLRIDFATRRGMSKTIEQDILKAINEANEVSALEALKISAFGKNGQITALMKELGQLSGEERATRGKELNILKNKLLAELDTKLDAMKREARAAELLNDKGDKSLMPSNGWREGTLHPITRTLQDMTSILGAQGFKLVEGPDIEDDFHNFTALNFPPDHPAREMHDTFYLPDEIGQEGLDAKRLLRTHTSTMQIRAMQEGEPPFRLMAFGRTYRSDYDQTHTPMFHQMELLVIDKNITMAHLKGTLLSFVQNYFGVSGDDDLIRLRPSFFPFTEPSVEVDIRCDKSGGKLVLGEGDDWLEILGAGMTHPNVIKACGLDPDVYQGFAAGMGVERLAMLKYGIPDLRNFFDGDVRWLSHYGFNPLDAA